MTHEESLAMADEFFSAFLVLELRGIKLARPADIIVRLDDPIIPLTRGDEIKMPEVKREIQINLTFEEGRVPK